MFNKFKKKASLLKVKKRIKQLKPSLQGHVDTWNGTLMTGWFNSPENEPVYLYCDGVAETIIEQNLYRKDLLDIDAEGNLGFRLPISINELRAKNVKEIAVGNDKGFLIGSPILLKEPKFCGFIDNINEHHFSGWICDESYPEANLEIDVCIDNEIVKTVVVNQPRLDLIDIGIKAENCGFSSQLSDFIDPISINYIEFKLKGTDLEVFPRESIQTVSSKAAALVQLQNILKNDALSANNEGLEWLNLEVLPYLIDQVRLGEDNLPLAKQKNKENKIDKVVDIIIPVYKGLDETINCINSVFSVKNSTEFNVVVINDCSPEPALTKALRNLQKELSFTLIENVDNLGFVQTVNKGMKLSDSKDVLLLNSDTVVTNYWLDKIVETAYSDITIGTVTPFSNNATICSYPRFCADNELPECVSLEELAQIVAKNQGAVDLPTAHGFSMFIKRRALDEVGFFDDKKWGKGYAEENDFSLRAAKLGWRNVMATNAFVHHLGSVSFAEDSAGFIAKNLKKLNGIYPDYTQNVESFIKLDPVRPFRNNIALSLLQKEVEKNKLKTENYEGSFIFVSLTIGGGTEVATNDLSKIHHDNNRSVFMLVCTKPNVWELKSQLDNSVIEYHLPQERAQLIEDLKSLDVAKFHIHHTLEFDKSIWDLPRDCDVEYDVTLHDYYTVCPRINLVDGSNYYCGEPSEAACNRCIKRNGTHESSFLQMEDLGDDIVEWRSFFEKKLQNAQKVITPSHDTKNRIIKYFKLDNIEAVYHPEANFDYKPKSLDGVKVVNIAFLGAIGVHKGLNVLKECAEYAYKLDLPVKFTVIGYTSDDKYFDELPNVTITGKYKRDDLSNLIEKHNVHVAGLFSVWPETYSYTLSEAMRNNLHVACFDMGAVVERLDSCIKSSNNPEEIINNIINECM